MAITDRRGVAVSSVDPPIAGDPNPGLAWKAPVRAATTGANIALAGLQTVDGVALAAADRVLVKDQTDSTTNGLYNASTGNWTRTIDAASNDKFTRGLQVIVTEGTVNHDAVYELTATNPITLGTSALTFALGGGISSSRRVATTAPLAGGGTLASDLTLSLTIGATLQVVGGALTIANNAVTNAMAAPMAAHTYKGNNTGAPANPIDLTATQLTAELNVVVGDSGSGGTKGLVPAPAAGDALNGRFLRADGTFTAAPIVLAKSAVATTLTGSTGETVQATITIPAGVIGPNGRIEVWATWSNNNSGNNKTFGIRFGASGAGTGGTLLWSLVNTTNVGVAASAGVANRNSASSQVGLGSLTGNTGWGATASAFPTASVNTANAAEITLTGNLANSGDSITLEAYRIVLIPGA